MSNPIARKHQQAFLEFAKDHLDELRTVLKESNDDEQRAIAAYVIGYVPKTNPKVVQLVVDDLQRSLRDPDDTVRNNTFRSLGAIAVLAAKRPYFGIRVSPTWLIEMLGSLVWEDRVAATGILLTLTEGRDKDLLERLRERSHTLAEMAGWKHLPHALPAFMLLGRVAGNGDAVIQKRWETDRTEAIREWTAGLGQQAK